MSESKVEFESAESVESCVAVVGMSGRFPKAADLEEFWRNLRAGVETIEPLTDEELLASGVGRALLDDPNYVKASSSLEGVEMFDASFFGFTPREAAIIDPQQRLFLECAWEALEGAGYDPTRYGGAIGVFGGVSISTYLIHLFANREQLGAVSAFQLVMSNDKDHTPTRVSYKLDLRGPSVAVQTACSTSLVAVHLACQSLLGGECDMALAGGASIPIPQRRGYLYVEGNIASPDGHCRAFDADALGTVGGSGAGVVLLKRLADALADGDVIHAVIRGSAVNNDGSLKVGYTAPSVEGQAKVIAEAQAVAGVEPDSITYVEAHGTGTPLGDPIEMAALTKVFSAQTSKKNFCAVGSVKTNIGHLDAAAGVAGLIKTVLALGHKEIPPSLHFKRPNPKIDFAGGPFFVNAELKRWEMDGAPRRAGVSSFGIGGTNAHVIVEEPPERPEPRESSPWQLLLLSARTEPALERMTDNLAGYLQANPGANLADVCHTLQVGRKTFDYRRALVCRDAADAWGALAARDATRVSTRFEKPRAREVVFMFSGQGAQRVGMGRGLYEREPEFRAHVDRCAELLAPRLGFDLREALYPGEGQAEAASRRLTQTAVTQPALFVTEYALARLWMSRGVSPAAMIGHSLGEYVAACLSGVFELGDALALVAERGRLMQSLPEGSMLAVPFAEEEARLVAGVGGLSLASVNGPRSCVISGSAQSIETLERRLNADGVACRRLQTSHAFHSSMTEPILEEFARRVERLGPRAPSIPYVSNVTGDWVRTEDATDSRYWSRHLRETVRFGDGLSRLLEEPGRVFVEVGPGQTLYSLLQRHPSRRSEHVALASLPASHADDDEQAAMLKALGRCWQAGVAVDWEGFRGGERCRRLQLPTYPFERQRCWVGSEAGPSIPAAGEAGAAREEQPVAPHAERAPQPRTQASATASNNRRPPARAGAERLVAQQLEIMTRQLEALRRGR
jgi:phthiocerol/phenolphthiocerol synthesis type-I polyketide synthase E